MATISKGNCYLCGKEIGKTAAKNHLLKNHNCENGQVCYLMKVEFKYDKNYWLYIDVPAHNTLLEIDDFLREIWLECCEHLSGFFIQNSEIEKNVKLSNFSIGDKLQYDYDFGSTTSLVITFIDKIVRETQKDSVRLLVRNVPDVYKCASCGDDADYICVECTWELDDFFYCEECLETHDHGDEMSLPITNSPRMGICGYCGDLDDFEFDPSKLLN